MIRERVDDFPRWRRAFDENAERRREAGSRGGHIFRSPDEPDRIVVFLAWEDMDRARDYLGSDAVRSEREAGDVRDDPEIWYLEELGRPAS